MSRCLKGLSDEALESDMARLEAYAFAGLGADIKDAGRNGRGLDREILILDAAAHVAEVFRREMFRKPVRAA
jgi:hypothetical protein